MNTYMNRSVMTPRAKLAAKVEAGDFACNACGSTDLEDNGGAWSGLDWRCIACDHRECADDVMRRLLAEAGMEPGDDGMEDPPDPRDREDF